MIPTPCKLSLPLLLCTTAILACHHKRETPLLIDQEPVFTAQDSFKNQAGTTLHYRKDYFLIQGAEEDTNGIARTVDSFIVAHGSPLAPGYDNYQMYFYKEAGVLTKQYINSWPADSRWRTLAQAEDNKVASFDFNDASLNFVKWENH